MTQKKKQQPMPILIQVTFNPKKQQIDSWLESCVIEHYGVLLEYSKNTATIRTADILFDKNKDGEDFYQVVINTNLKVTKEVCS